MKGKEKGNTVRNTVVNSKFEKMKEKSRKRKYLECTYIRKLRVFGISVILMASIAAIS